MALYTLLFGLGSYLTELMNGMGAIKYLDPAYPYHDLVLWPSLFYFLGFFEHTTPLPMNMEKNEDHPLESDPSHAEDIIIDDFTISL